MCSTSSWLKVCNFNNHPAPEVKYSASQTTTGYIKTKHHVPSTDDETLDLESDL